jgi:hypothetical protein
MDAAFAFQRSYETGEKLVVGVNSFQIEGEKPIDILQIPDDLAERIKAAAAKVPELRLALITNRGGKVWPQGFKETFCTDIAAHRSAPLSLSPMDASSTVVIVVAQELDKRVFCERMTGGDSKEARDSPARC